jgi:hypothetical protein
MEKDVVGVKKVWWWSRSKLQDLAVAEKLW